MTLGDVMERVFYLSPLIKYVAGGLMYLVAVQCEMDVSLKGAGERDGARGDERHR